MPTYKNIQNGLFKSLNWGSAMTTDKTQSSKAV